MIKEFAFGTHNRHHFQDANKAGEWEGLDSDTFVSFGMYIFNMLSTACLTVMYPPNNKGTNSH